MSGIFYIAHTYTRLNMYRYKLLEVKMLFVNCIILPQAWHTKAAVVIRIFMHYQK